MTLYELAFKLASTWVLPFWLSMMLLPRARITQILNQSIWGPALPILLYGVTVIPAIHSVLPLLARPDPAKMGVLLSQPVGTTAAWLHFLALDLFAGQWIFSRSQEAKWKTWQTTPLLILTLMFGPLGVGVFLLGRRTKENASRR